MLELNGKKRIEYVSSGLFRSVDMWCHPERIIDSFEVIFVLKGEVHIREEETEYALRENDLLLLEPSKLHVGTKTSADEVSFYWFHFNTDVEIPWKRLKIENAYSLKTMMSQLLHITNTAGYSSESHDLICALLLEEIGFCASGDITSPTSLSVEIKEYIRLNISKPLTVKGVAEHFGYHENYIGKIFKSVNGVGMKQYIADIKIKKAKELLNTTLYTVKEIGFLLGFSGENNFIKFFKYHSGLTPTEHRNIYTNIHINNA